MRNNARSQGRWSKHQESRRRKLQDRAYEELIYADELDHLCRLNSLRERYLKLQHPRATREAKEYREYATSIFLSALKPQHIAESPVD
jgi:hypothetical protein